MRGPGCHPDDATEAGTTVPHISGLTDSDSDPARARRGMQTESQYWARSVNSEHVFQLIY